MRKTLAVLSVTVLVLLALGVVLVASASGVGVRVHGVSKDPHFFLTRQLIWFGVALVVGFFASRFDYHWWVQFRWSDCYWWDGFHNWWCRWPGRICWWNSLCGKLRWWSERRGFFLAGLCATVLLLLALVILPGIRHEVNGSARWLNLGPLKLQPSEFAKIMTVIAMGAWLDRLGYRVRLFKKGACLSIIWLGVIVGLLVAEPDFGAAMVVGLTGGMLMFVAGVRIPHLAIVGAAGVAAVGAVMLLFQNRLDRIMAHMDGTPYQVKQSLLAFQSGGLFGVGFNNSLQKWHYLPEAHTDFIYAIGGEEFGFVFSLFVILAYVVILFCGLRVSMNAVDPFGRLLAFGMTFLLVFQAAWNIAVVTNCTITKGLALPFLSYGGSNLITAFAAVGTLLNIGRHVGVYDEGMHTQVVRNAAARL